MPSLVTHLHHDMSPHIRTIDSMQEAAFYNTKGRQSHAKKPSFGKQKAAYRQAIDYQHFMKWARDDGQTAART